MSAPWQPIDTAPKDGSCILVTDGLRIWSDAAPFADGDRELGAVTHWMPLPALPMSAIAHQVTRLVSIDKGEWVAIQFERGYASSTVTINRKDSLAIARFVFEAIGADRTAPGGAS